MSVRDYRSEREVGTIQLANVQAFAFDAAGDLLITMTASEAQLWAVKAGRDLAPRIEARVALER